MDHKSQLGHGPRIKMLLALGPLGGLALTLSIILGRLEDANLDFLSGFLIGLSIVGNIAYIFIATRYLSAFRRQQ